MLSLQWDICVAPPTPVHKGSKKQILGEEGYKGCKSQRWWIATTKPVFQSQQGSCTCKMVMTVCTRCIQTLPRQNTSIEREVGHKILPLAKELLPTNSCWEGVSFFLVEGHICRSIKEAQLGLFLEGEGVLRQDLSYVVLAVLKLTM